MPKTNSQIEYKGATWWQILSVMLIGMRLTNEIDWGWWLVTLPLYAPYVLFVVLFVVSKICGGNPKKAAKK